MLQWLRHPVLDRQAGGAGEVRGIVGHQGHPQGKGMGRDQLVERIPSPFAGGPANRAIGPGGGPVEGCDRNLPQEAIQCLAVAVLLRAEG
jgi:hypothetical protein